jgi:choline dehydrogenase-like flavoprotein
VDWNFTSAGMEGLGGRSIPYYRGKALGGSSTLEFLAWTRGSADDFDNWASITGDEGWSWDNMLPYFKKVGTYHIRLWYQLIILDSPRILDPLALTKISKPCGKKVPMGPTVLSALPWLLSPSRPTPSS